MEGPDGDPLLIIEHGKIDRAREVVLFKFRRGAHIDDLGEFREVVWQGDGFDLWDGSHGGGYLVSDTSASTKNSG